VKPERFPVFIEGLSGLLFGGQPPLEIFALLGPFLSRLVHLVMQFVPDVYELILGNVQTATLARVSLS
jgi:hypothetical protein